MTPLRLIPVSAVLGERSYRLATPADVRRTLVRHLHDPAGFAAAVGLSGNGFHGIARPSTLMVIPEVTFTYDGGVADGATRRLVVPESSSEP